MVVDGLEPTPHSSFSNWQLKDYIDCVSWPFGSSIPSTGENLTAAPAAGGSNVSLLWKPPQRYTDCPGGIIERKSPPHIRGSRRRPLLSGTAQNLQSDLLDWEATPPAWPNACCGFSRANGAGCHWAGTLIKSRFGPLIYTSHFESALRHRYFCKARARQICYRATTHPQH